MADGRVVIDVLLEDGQVAKGVANLDKELGGLGQSGEQASLGIGKIVTALGLVTLGAKAIGLIRDSIDSAFRRIDTMESFDRTMTAITGSSEEAAAALDRTSDAVTGTAYGLDVAAAAVQNFVTRGTDINKATDYIASWGDAVAFYGDGTNEQLSNVSDALAKMLTTNKVTMDQVNRLYDAGIAAPEMYADATGKSMEEVEKGFRNGEISAEEFVDVVTKALQEGTDSFVSVAGAAKESGNSWGNVFTNMRAAVTRGTIAIIQSIDEMLTSNGLPDMRTMVAEFGKMFENTLKQIAESIPGLINNMIKVYDTLKPWLPLIGGISAGVGSAVLAFAGFNSVTRIITNVTNAVKGLNTTMLANPWFWVIAAIIAAAILIYVYWEPISDFFIQVWEKIKVASIAVWDSLKSVWSATVDWFKNLWETITGFFSNLWQSIVEIATGIWDAVIAKWTEVYGSATTIFAPLIEFFIMMWETISTNALEYWDNMMAMFSAVWENIQIAASAAWEIIKNVILGAVLLLINLVTGDLDEFKSNLSAIWGNIKEAASTIWNALKDSVSIIIATLIANIQLAWDTFKTYIAGLWSAIWDTAVNIFDNIKSSIQQKTNEAKSLLESIWNNIKNYFSTVLTNIWNTVKQKFDDVKNAVSERMNQAKQSIEDIWKQAEAFLRNINLLQVGKDIINGLINGIKSMTGKVKNAVSDIASDIKTNIKSALSIFSPSRWMRDEIGVMFMRGFEVGLDKEKPRTLAKVDEATEWMKPDPNGFKNPLKGVGVPSVIRLASNQVSKGIGMATTSRPQQVDMNALADALANKIKIVSSGVYLDNREVGRMQWKVVSEFQERNLGNRDKFRR
ncbi:tape measure protein [Alkalihalophilus marmarensis]|uniref:phage tail protein n=1 Tax=Alkalihalophilus marmarensis TaxID=521377 RepID=UPI002E22BE79|nr:tape measure protein [Alkalihalophilus marmarensis]